MYLDQGRIADLIKLNKGLRDSSLPRFMRARIWKSKNQILEQSKDKKLSHLRQQLMMCAKTKDRKSMWKLTCQIKDYLGEELPTGDQYYER